MPGSCGVSRIEADKRCYYCVNKDEQVDLDFKEIKKQLLESSGLSPNASVVQVVGDSAKYSLKGTEAARQFLITNLEDPNLLILWGYTGNGQNEDQELDVNQLVSSWVDEDQSRSNRSLANVVDYHTPLALSDWGCNMSATNRQFFLVCGDARFGDDVISSDYLTDCLICLEGGVQSLRQIFNCLKRDKQVKIIYNLRGDKNPLCYSAAKNAYLDFLSAGEFLAELKEAVDKLKREKGFVNEDDIVSIKNTYFGDSTYHRRYLFNPERKDADTKQFLFDHAWKQLLEEKLWDKLHLCEIQKAGI